MGGSFRAHRGTLVGTWNVKITRLFSQEKECNPYYQPEAELLTNLVTFALLVLPKNFVFSTRSSTDACYKFSFLSQAIGPVFMKLTKNIKVVTSDVCLAYSFFTRWFVYAFSGMRD